MKPIPFDEQTKVLTKPDNMTDEECRSMSVWSDGFQCISCWKGGFIDRLRFLFTGRMWVCVITGSDTQPPIWASPKRPFKKSQENTNEKT